MAKACDHEDMAPGTKKVSARGGMKRSKGKGGKKAGRARVKAMAKKSVTVA